MILNMVFFTLQIVIYYIFFKLFVAPADVVFNVMWHIDIRSIVWKDSRMLDLQKERKFL